MEHTPRNHRVTLAVLAVLIGLFMAAVAPILIQTSLDRVVASLTEVSKEKPVYSSGILLFSFAFPLVRGLIFMAGVALILLAQPISKGEEWSYPAGLLAAAFPAAGGMFMFLPYVSWVEGFPIPMAISMIGLVMFLSLIFLRAGEKWLKLAQFLALTASGVMATHAFTVGIGNMRMLLTRPGKPLYEGLEWWVLAWSNPVQWIAVILLFFAIYLMAARKIAGWRLAVLAAVSILAIDVPTQVIRTTMSTSTSWDYLYGSLISLVLLFSLFYPRFRAALTGQELPPEAPTPDSSAAAIA